MALYKVQMSTAFLLLFLATKSIPNAIASPAPPSSQAMPPSSSVVELNMWNFQGSVGDGRLWFVEFYVPWCRGCKRMVEEYDKLAEAFRSNRDVVISRFDCMQHEDTCERLGVDRTPTLKLFFNGKVAETYRADIYHVDLMGPFLMRMLNKYILQPEASTGVGSHAKEAEADAEVAAGGSVGVAEVAAGAEGPCSQAAGEAGSSASHCGADAAPAGHCETSGGSGGQRDVPDDGIKATPVQPGVYDKPADGSTSAVQEGTDTSGGMPAGSVGDPPVAGGAETVVTTVTAEAGSDKVSGHGDSLSGASSGDGFGKPLARRGRHMGQAAETLKRERDEL